MSEDLSLIVTKTVKGEAEDAVVVDRTWWTWLTRRSDLWKPRNAVQRKNRREDDDDAVANGNEKWPSPNRALQTPQTTGNQGK